jgi:hypothetical protein
LNSATGTGRRRAFTLFGRRAAILKCSVAQRDLSASRQHQFKVISANATKTLVRVMRLRVRGIAPSHSEQARLSISTEIVVIMERPVFRADITVKLLIYKPDLHWSQNGGRWGEGYRAVRRALLWGDGPDGAGSRSAASQKR